MIAHRRALAGAARGEARKRGVALPAQNTPAQVEYGSGEYHPEDIVSITEAAAQLRVSRNDMHLLLKPREAWGLKYYERRDIAILEMIATDKTRPECFVILMLRDRKLRSDERAAKPANPSTKTGKTKKRNTEPQKRRQHDIQDEDLDGRDDDGDYGFEWSEYDSKRNRTTSLVPRDDETSNYTPNEAPYDRGPMVDIGQGPDE
jgi:hypothetical protein